MRIGLLQNKVWRLGLLTLFLGAFTYHEIRNAEATFASVKHSYQPSDTWVVDRNNLPLESIRTVQNHRRLDWVSLSEISPAFKETLIKVEDHRFYSHPGIDFLAIFSAVKEGLTEGKLRGASTITMQLTGLLNRTTHTHRGFWQKLEQMFAALRLSFYWSKEEVLEAYSNLVPFRGELVGLRAASLGYFQKNPSGLEEEEAALLISLLRAPNSTPLAIGRRACKILKRENCDSILAMSNKVFSKPYYLPRSREVVPVVSSRFVESGEKTSVIHTSLDRNIQTLAMNLLREQLGFLHVQNVNDGAVLVLETESGRVVAYAANAGSGVASAEQVDGIQTRRQAGSTIKPFVYATAFEMNLLSPSSLLEDSPADIPVASGRVYHPSNYDHIFRGAVSAGDALGSSINVPAIRALHLVTEDRVLENLGELGFKNLQSDDYYGPALALGAIDVTLWELTQGYRKFAVPSPVFTDATRDTIFNVLAAPEHRRFTFGMDSILTLPFAAAVKTGTSKDMRDNWCVGWTPKYTVGVWVGNFGGEPMWNVSGISGAAPIWRSLMLALHPGYKSSPAHYVPAAEPLKTKTLSRIRYPVADMIIGFDSNIPTRSQKLPIEIENPQKGQKLFLNNQPLKVSETTLWPVRRGKFKVELKSVVGKLIDSIKFEVR